MSAELRNTLERPIIDTRSPTWTDLSTGAVEKLDPETSLFPIEHDLIQKLEESIAHLPPEQIQIVKSSLELSLVAHIDQFRGTGHPYSEHTLWVAIFTAKRQMDGISIASALCHDVVEETDYTLDDIVNYVYSGDADKGRQMRDTVEGLSKIRISKRRSDDDESYLTNIMRSVIDNPRVPIIKIEDRLHNMRTLAGLSPSARRRQCIETIEVHAPLATLLGMHDEAQELRELAFQWQDKNNAALLDSLSSMYPAYYDAYCQADIASVEDEFAGERYRFIPRQTELVDLISNTDMTSNGQQPELFNSVDVLIDTDFGNGQVWGYDTETVIRRLAWSDRYELINDNTSRFYQDVADQRVNSYVVRARDLLTERIIELHVFPQEAYELYNTSLSDLYLPVCEYEPARPGEGENPDIFERKLRAIRKHEWYKQKQSAIDSTPERDSLQMLHDLTPRTARGMIRVNGVEENQKQSFAVKEGATVMDFVRACYPRQWTRFVSAQIGDSIVSPDTIVSHHSTISVEFGEGHTARYTPEWIHAFHHDGEGIQKTRKALVQAIRNERKTTPETITNAELAVLRVGRTILENVMRTRHGTNLKIGITDAMGVIASYRENYSEKDFYLDIGLGKVPQETLDQVVDALKPENDATGAIETVFSSDQAGQMAELATIIASLGISAQNIEVESLGNNAPSIIVISLSSGAMERIDEIVKKITSSQKCKELGLLPNLVSFSSTTLRR